MAGLANYAHETRALAYRCANVSCLPTRYADARLLTQRDPLRHYGTHACNAKGAYKTHTYIYKTHTYMREERKGCVEV